MEFCVQVMLQALLWSELGENILYVAGPNYYQIAYSLTYLNTVICKSVLCIKGLLKSQCMTAMLSEI